MKKKDEFDIKHEFLKHVAEWLPNKFQFLNQESWELKDETDLGLIDFRWINAEFDEYDGIHVDYFARDDVYAVTCLIGWESVLELKFEDPHWMEAIENHEFQSLKDRIEELESRISDLQQLLASIT